MHDRSPTATSPYKTKSGLEVALASSERQVSVDAGTARNGVVDERQANSSLLTDLRWDHSLASSGLPRIIIVGGGFGGLACAKALGNAPALVTVIDRRNHNLFQPLLYQVATAALSPADIAEPIRKTLGRFGNMQMFMAEVLGVDAEKRIVATNCGELPYDHLVIATGSEYNYFGNDEWRQFAPGLKTIREARQIRQRLLSSFERAEWSSDEAERRAFLTSVVIGGGPTGVEMAGAISELGRFMVTRDFRHIPPEDVKVILVEAGSRILASFPESLSSYAQQYLSDIGVEVRLESRVSSVLSDRVTIGEETVRAGTIIWGAGIKPSAAANWLGLEGAARGKIPVGPDLAVHGYSNIYCIGDTAEFVGLDGKPVPALAQVAKQQGAYLGKLLRRRLAGKQASEPFYFRDRGNTAVIGRHAAIFDFGSWQMKGRLAWLLWAIVHVYLLVSFEKRLLVSLQWIWRYMTRQRGARIIDEDPGL